MNAISTSIKFAVTHNNNKFVKIVHVFFFSLYRFSFFPSFRFYCTTCNAMQLLLACLNTTVSNEWFRQWPRTLVRPLLYGALFTLTIVWTGMLGNSIDKWYYRAPKFRNKFYSIRTHTKNNAKQKIQFVGLIKFQRIKKKCHIFRQTATPLSLGAQWQKAFVFSKYMAHWKTKWMRIKYGVHP